MNNKCIQQHSCVRLRGVDVDDTLSWRLQKFENKVARYVPNYKVTEISRKDLYDEIGWLMVRQRIHFQTVMMLHKSLYTYDLPPFICIFMPLTCYMNMIQGFH